MPAQFEFLNTLRRERRLVVLYLIGGTRLQGRIASFDQQAVLLETKTGMVLCSQDQISTLGPDVGRSAARPRSRNATDQDLPATVEGPRPATREAMTRAQEVESAYETLASEPGTAQNVPVVTQKVRRKIAPPGLKTGTDG